MALRAAELLLEASRHPLACAVKQGLVDSDIAESDRLLLGVSGGADSMAMLVLVAAIRARTDRTLDSIAVLTCNHGLRAEAEAECGAVLALCAGLGVRHAASVRLELSRKGNILAAAREARLAALWSAARSHDARTVLVAHQADDVAEGLVLALARGGGLDSAVALASRREFPEGAVCRPLLRIRKRALRAFLEALGVAWHEDPGNGVRARGALRTDPALADLMERIADGSGDLVREAGELVVVRDALARELVAEGSRSIPRARFDQSGEAVRAAAIVRMASSCGGSLARTAIEEAVRSTDDPERKPRHYAGRGGTLRIDARQVEWIPADTQPGVTAD